MKPRHPGWNVFSRVLRVPRKAKEERYACTTLIDKDFVFLDGKGSRIQILHKGVRRTVIDASAAVSTKNVGYGNEGVRRVVLELLRAQHDVTGYPHHDMENDYALDLAWIMTELAPLKGDRQVVFANSGTEAVEAAIKLCCQARARSGRREDKRRNEFISFFGAFHGRTLGSLSLNCSKPVQREHYPVNAFSSYHTFFPAKHPYFVYDDDGDVRYVNMEPNEYLEVFKKDCRKGRIDLDSVNAVVLELVQGEGGLNVVSRDALQDLVKFLKENGVYIVVDEIQTGLGRTGKLFAFEHFNIEPDAVTVAKSIAFGIPCSAVIYKKGLGWTEKGQQSSTYAGSPLVSVAAIEVLRQIVQEDLPQRAQDLGDKVLGPGLRNIAQDYSEVVHNVRGLGLMHGIEFWNANTRKPAPNFRELVFHEALKRGVLFLDAGASVLRITPPLTIGSNGEDKRHNELGKILDVLEESIRAARRKAKKIN